MMDEKIYQRQITKQGLADSFMVLPLVLCIDFRMEKGPREIVSPWKN